MPFKRGAPLEKVKKQKYKWNVSSEFLREAILINF